MKTLISAVILFALLMSGQALADSYSKIGKKIDNEYTVVIDGKKLESAAISIDGVSYLPSREIAEVLEYKVSFEGEKIILIKQIEMIGEPPVRKSE